MSRQSPNRRVNPEPRHYNFGESSSCPSSFVRSQSDVEYHREQEYKLREKGKQIKLKFYLEGRGRIFVKESDLGEGLPVLPNPRRTDDGFIAWSVR